MATDLTSTYPCPDCPEDCGDFVMPVFSSEDCIDTITSELSEIKELFLAEYDPEDRTKPLGGPADWTLKADWEAAISNTTTGKVRRLYGIGDVAEAEKTTRTFHNNKQKVVNRAYPLTFDVLDLNQINYDAMRAFQCGGDIRIWFMDRGNYLYGGQDGIPLTISDADSLFERGADAYKKIVIKGIYNALCAPDRTPSPWGEPSITP
jgi:hypothetical protein